MLQRFLTYIIMMLIILTGLYFAFFMVSLLLPFLLLLFIVVAVRVWFQKRAIKKMLKQAQQQASVAAQHKHFRKVSDDNIIDVEYEEVRTNDKA